jgi:hypothetical protein
MRAMLVVAMIAVVGVATPVFADETADTEAMAGPQTVEVYHSAGDEFGMAFASAFLSVLYTPVRMVYGIVGAEFGGVEGFLTGGDLRVARGTWRVTTEGDYYIRPDHFDGTKPFEFTNVKPVVHERYIAPGPPSASSGM